MDMESFHQYCLLKAGTEESFPFDENVLVYKVGGKMFAATNINSEGFIINLKCNPERALQLREAYPEIEPGYHMNKKHWNSVDCEGSLPNRLLKDLIDHSYDLVFKSLKKIDRNTLLSQDR